ncbi:tetratricopeptide repeat protein [Streptomyces sp. NRRL S-813]|uniref:tetratricopeptide repeat protein n=1 Tax=Streptomyces sp. NRRL S-813 TaxID=1463919 RepID=UPI00131E31AD|nr:tetratricopeptide repeat protein [Streptomyces sp. NRRL S-813]
MTATSSNRYSLFSNAGFASACLSCCHSTKPGGGVAGSSRNNDGSYEAALQELGEALTDLKRRRGAPSYDRIRTRGEKHFGARSAISKASMSEIFAGRRGPASLDRLLWLVCTLLSYDDGEEIDPPGRRDPRLQPWREHWNTIEALRAAARRRPASPAADSPEPQAPQPAGPGAAADPVADGIPQVLVHASAINDHDDRVLQRTRDDLADETDIEADRDASEADCFVLPDYSEFIMAAADQGRHQDALKMAAATVTLATDRFGPEHPLTLTELEYLAHTRARIGDAAGAAAELTELLAVRRRVLGPKHAETLRTRHFLAVYRGRAGDAAGAAAELTKLLPVREEVLGSNDLDTLRTREEIAVWREQAGDAAGAAAALTELLHILEKRMGPQADWTVKVRGELARCSKIARRRAFLDRLSNKITSRS